MLRIVVHENLSARQESEVQGSYGRLSHFALISSRDLVLLCTQCVPIPWPSSGGGHRGAIRECSACARPSIQGTRHPGYILLSQLASRSARPLGPRPLHVSGCCAGWKLQRRERGGGGEGGVRGGGGIEGAGVGGGGCAFCVKLSLGLSGFASPLKAPHSLSRKPGSISTGQSR